MSYNKAVSLISKGRANPSDYQVIFPTKVLENSAVGDFKEYISYFCRAITLPGTSHAAMQLRGHENVGIGRNIITGKNFGSPVVMTFSERTDLVVYSTMKRWLDQAVINSEQNGNRNLRVNYYDTTKCDIEILKLEPMRTNNRYDNDIFTNEIYDNKPKSNGHRVTGRWKLLNCIPLAVEQVTLSMESADSLMDWTFSIAYESFEFQRINKDYNDYLGSVKEQKTFDVLGGITKNFSGLIK